MLVLYGFPFTNIPDSQDSKRKGRLLWCYCTFLPPFLLMILVQNFMLIKIHIKTWVSKSAETKLFTFKVLYFHQLNHQLWQFIYIATEPLVFLALLIVLWSVQVSLGSIIFTSQAIQQPCPQAHIFAMAGKRNF